MLTAADYLYERAGFSPEIRVTNVRPNEIAMPANFCNIATAITSNSIAAD